MLGAACIALLWFGAQSAHAVILPPTTIDGPSTEILALGGVAMAPDGTGGLVYTKSVAGVPHIFASRYTAGQWGPPVRVDSNQPYPASQPAIAAGPGGRLMVVWVTEVATLVSGEIRDGLYSATLGQGATEFGRPLLVDPNVGKGSGVDPSLAGATPGQAIVTYRVITKTFALLSEKVSAVQLRPGDVLADIRVARMEGDRWSRLGAINRDPAVSMRPPTATNGPKVAIGATGRAVVAWQEPDQTGAARVWMRRISGTTLGPVLAASPETWEGKPVTEDAEALSVAVSSLDRARVAVRIGGGSTSGGQIFVTSLASNASPDGGKPAGPTQIEAAGSGSSLGPPAVAVADNEGTEGSMLLAYTAGAAVRIAGLEENGNLERPSVASGPPADIDSPTVAFVDKEGGGTVAYETTAEGLPGVAVRQEVPGGETQTGSFFSPIGGPVSQLVGDGVESGDALIAFSQGEGGSLAIVADRVSSPPARFPVQVPAGWVRPGRAQVRWGAAPSGVGGLTYSLLIDGRAVRSGLTRRQMTPPRTALKNGLNRVQVVATDQLGSDLASRPMKLRVDSQPPSLGTRLRAKSGDLTLRLKDAQSGLKGATIRMSFGDGTSSRRRATVSHHYALAGIYLVKVRASDRVGNRLVQQFRVAVN